MPNNNDSKDTITQRVERLEVRANETEERMDGLEARAFTTEGQVSRIQSHIESEIGLSRKDTARIELRLFGKEDEEFGGHLGALRKKVGVMDVWFRAIICACGIIIALMTIYQGLTRIQIQQQQQQPMLQLK